MATDRSKMTVRIVPLHSAEASDARLEGSVAEGVAVVGQLTAMGWAIAKLPLPTYTRETMPVTVTKRPPEPDGA